MTPGKSFRLLSTAKNISPMVAGFFKPVIIIPGTVISGLPISQLEAILAHEIAHIRRYDHILIFLQVFANHILFFHPLAWFLSASINRERENSCDDLAIGIGIDPLNYIKALTMVQK